MSTFSEIQLHLQQLLCDVAEARLPRPASLTATEAQDTRLQLLKQVTQLINELMAVRNAQHLAEEGQMHVYHVLAALFRVKEQLLVNAGLDEIQSMLEDVNADLSQAQQPTPAGHTKTGGKPQ